MIRNMIANLKEKGVSLNSVILLAFIVNTTVVLVLSSVILFSRYNETLVESAMQSTQQTTDNISKSVSSLVLEKVEILNSIKDIINFEEELVKKEKLKWVQELNSDIIAIVLYNTYGDIITCVQSDEYELKNNYKEKNLSFAPYYFSKCEDFYISAPHVNNMFYKQYPWVVTFMIPSYDQNDQLVYITMDIEFSKISQYIDKISIGSRGYVYIANEYGTIIYHPKQQVIYSELKEENTDIIPTLYATGEGKTESNIYTASGVDNIEWRIIGVSSIQEMVSAKNDEFLKFAIIVILISITISSGLAMIIVKGFTNPFKKLINAMRSFEKDIDEYSELKLSGFTEVVEISSSFDNMAVNIKELKERVILEEKELRKTELKALQAQINPHFLYNTLDSIFWLCKERGNEDAAKMVAALSNTFRISINRGKDEIYIKDEIKHVESYLFIQNLRYKDQFTYIFEVEEEILNYKCLKILLQPFVENAIYHGLNRMIDDGEIIIKAYKQEDYIIFEVVDNGIGMDEEQVEALYHENSDKAGVGVKNVHNRIVIHCGEDYGVSIFSELDEGTRIVIKIPLIEEGNNNE